MEEDGIGGSVIYLLVGRKVSDGVFVERGRCDVGG